MKIVELRSSRSVRRRPQFGSPEWNEQAIDWIGVGCLCWVVFGEIFWLGLSR